MTAGELIAKLGELPPDVLVVVATDGTWCSPVDDVATGWYAPEVTWAGSLTEDVDAALDGWRPDEDHVRAVALYPTR